MRKINNIKKPGKLSDDDKDFYSNLRNLIISEKEMRGLTNTKISEMSNVNRSIIANFLNGKLDYLSFHNAIKILTALYIEEAIELKKCIDYNEFD